MQKKYYERYVQDGEILAPPISVFVLGLLTSSLFFVYTFGRKFGSSFFY